MSLPPDSPRAVVATTLLALLAGDAAALGRCFAEDAVLEFPLSAEPATPTRIEGRNAICNMAAALAERFRRDGTRLRRLETMTVHETADPEIVVAEFAAPSEAGAGAPEFEAPGEAGMSDPGRPSPDSQVFRVRAGQVHLLRDYLGPGPRSTPLEPRRIRSFSGSAWG